MSIVVFVSNPVNLPKDRTNVIYGPDNVINSQLKFFTNSNKQVDICMHYITPPFAIHPETIKNAFVEASKRGVKLRYLTEITKDNIFHCKDLMGIVQDKLRHLDGIKGNFMVSEIEYLAPIGLLEKGEIWYQLIHSNVKALVEHQQHVFNSLWNKAIPAKQKIREIEEGTIESHGTRLVEEPEQVAKEIRNIVNVTKGDWSICSTFDGLLMFYNNFGEMKIKEYNNINKNDPDTGTSIVKSKCIRWIGTIDKNRIELIKTFLDLGMQIKHIQSLPPMNFAVSSEGLYATIDEMKDGQMAKSLLISNDPTYVKHFKSIFEEFWKKGVNAAERIKDIEKGTDLPDIEVIESSVKAKNLYIDIVKSAKQEILLMFPSTNAFFGQRKIDFIQYAQEAANNRDVKVRILMPAYKSTEQTIHHQNFEIRNVEQTSETKATILVVDRKESLVIELKDDTKSKFHEATGLSTYSNSKAGVLSFVAIFESLWKQSELYQQLKKSNEQLAVANEKLRIRDELQQEFINIAAHELRTPAHSILGYAELLEMEKPEIGKEYLNPIFNNAKRLQRLIDDILDVARIDTQTLKLQKEKFNLKDIIRHIVQDYEKQIKREEERLMQQPWIKKINKGIRLNYKPIDILILADKNKISQVISNLLDNAVKFTTEGNIIISTNITNTTNESVNSNDHIENNTVIVTIKDTGAGIDPAIFQRLFTKFTTKSEKGTGLGLYISKCIIEAHGGRIWAENNNNSDMQKGATFAFSIPVNNCQ